MRKLGNKNISRNCFGWYFFCVTNMTSWRGSLLKNVLGKTDVTHYYQFYKGSIYIGILYFSNGEMSEVCLEAKE